MLKVGVVDSGFREDQIEWIEDAASFYLQDGALWMGDPELDKIDHGCRIIDIIHHHCSDAPIYSAQVFDKHGVTSTAQVAAAINWLCDQKVDVINLSLGLREHRESLAQAVKRATSAGIILCASSPARGEPVYPSAYPGVFRMTGDARCAIDEICCLETEFADFAGHVLGFDQIQDKAGSSLGCAHMSGHVLKILHEQPNLAYKELGNALKKRASYFGAEHKLY